MGKELYGQVLLTNVPTQGYLTDHQKGAEEDGDSVCISKDTIAYLMEYPLQCNGILQSD